MAGFSFTVGGLEPWQDPTWATATPLQRLAYFRVCRELVLIEYDRQLAAGLDRNGQGMARLAPSTIAHRRSAMGAADKYAPPLSPAHELSRARALLDGRVVGNAIQVFWRFDPVSRKRWGQVMDYHRQGSARLPVRDVFGLAPDGRRSVLSQAHAWWAGFSRGLPVRAPRRQRSGVPGRALVATQPAYQPKNPALHGTQKGRITNLQIGNDVYSLSNGSAKELFSAIKAGKFTGFRSYE